MNAVSGLTVMLVIGRSTVKSSSLVAVPFVLVTVIFPVVAPAGTDVTIMVSVEDVTVA